MIFLHKRLYTPLWFRKRIETLYRKGLPKHAPFITFSLFLIVSEVFNISNKYWLKRGLTSLLYFEKNSTPHFSKHSLFTRLSLFLIVTEMWYISNKHWLLNKKIKNIFAQVTLHPSFMPISTVVIFRNIHFLSYLYYFWQLVSWVIIQANTMEI